ncbi:MAG: hypothetical protein QOE73_1003 [Verrucomicrobiota bacterium]
MMISILVTEAKSRAKAELYWRFSHSNIYRKRLMMNEWDDKTEMS